MAFIERFIKLGDTQGIDMPNSKLKTVYKCYKTRDLCTMRICECVYVCMCSMCTTCTCFVGAYALECMCMSVCVGLKL